MTIPEISRYIRPTKLYSFSKAHVVCRRGLTEVDCVLCGKKKKDIVKKKNTANQSTGRCECPDVSRCPPCSEDMRARSGKQSNGISPPYTYVALLFSRISCDHVLIVLKVAV